MLKNYVLTALRSISRNPVYFILNLSGLTLGIVCCMLIVIFITNELSFDQFHSKKDQIYRINYNFQSGDNRTISPSVPVFVGPYLRKNFPEVENATRFLHSYGSRAIRYGEKTFDENRFAWVDSSFFEILDFKGIHGRLETALDKPGTVVLTESTARRYFGETSAALGKVLVINNKRDYEVTAVIEDVPSNSHFTFDFLTSIYSIEGLDDETIQWNNPNYTTFLLLKEGTSTADLARKIDAWVNPTVRGSNRLTLDVESLNDVHFNTTVFNFGGQLVVTDMKYLYIFSAIGLLVLIVACINYVNLATARATTRAREVGMRKSVGASFGQLIAQFLSESFVLLLPAVLLGALGCWLLLPVLQSVLGRSIEVDFASPTAVGLIFAAWVVLSVLSGFYPALIIARFNPGRVLRGAAVGLSGARLRQGLVVLQFTVSTVMIVGALVVLSQLNYMQSTKLGLDKENVIIIRGNSDINPKLDAFLNSVKDLPGVVSASGTWRSPFETVVGNGFNLSENPTDDGWVVVGGVSADENYISTVGLELMAGRNFDSRLMQDTINEFIVNEAFLHDFGLTADEAIGKKTSLGITMDKGPGTIVGVVKDFHFTSLQHRIQPVVLFNRRDWFGGVVVRLKAGAMSETLAGIEAVWKTLAPARPFNHAFLDDQYDALYRTEQRIGTLVTVFASVAVAIACIGLLGLASFTTVQRAKEISIRKALGATSQSIVFLLSKGYVRLMVVAFVVAVPVSGYMLNRWLEAFAYRIDIGPLYYIVSFGLLTFTAFATVALQSYKASVENPVKNLRTL